MSGSSCVILTPSTKAPTKWWVGTSAALTVLSCGQSGVSPRPGGVCQTGRWEGDRGEDITSRVLAQPAHAPDERKRHSLGFPSIVAGDMVPPLFPVVSPPPARSAVPRWPPSGGRSARLQAAFCPRESRVAEVLDKRLQFLHDLAPHAGDVVPPARNRMICTRLFSSSGVCSSWCGRRADCSQCSRMSRSRSWGVCLCLGGGDIFAPRCPVQILDANQRPTDLLAVVAIEAGGFKASKATRRLLRSPPPGVSASSSRPPDRLRRQTAHSCSSRPTSSVSRRAEAKRSPPERMMIRWVESQRATSAQSDGRSLIKALLGLQNWLSNRASRRAAETPARSRRVNPRTSAVHGNMSSQVPHVHIRTLKGPQSFRAESFCLEMRRP